MLDLKIKYNELTAEQFIELWETVWGDGPSLEQTRLAMKHTIFRVSIWDGDCIVAKDKGLSMNLTISLW